MSTTAPADRIRDHQARIALRHIIIDYTSRAGTEPEYAIAAAELAALHTRNLPADHLAQALSQRVAATPLLTVAQLLRAAHTHITAHPGAQNTTRTGGQP